MVEPPPQEEDNEDVIAAPEPPEKQIKEGEIDASYSSYGIEVSLGDGNMCVGDLSGKSPRLKPGMVLQIACSDDRSGKVRIDTVPSASRATASLILGAAKGQKISVVIDY